MRSGFERSLAAQLKKLKVPFKYEPFQIKYVTEHTYTPDFELPNGIIIEAKGKMDQYNRAKMLAVKEQNPDYDIRFVFMRASNKLSKRSKMTYAEWAEKAGFKWAEGSIPLEWIEE